MSRSGWGSRHRLQAVGSLDSPRPRRRLYLAEPLALDQLADARGPVPFHRSGRRVELERPITHATFAYHGELTRSGSRDFKSHAWLEADEVRLTEITLWYPVIYDGTSDVPWPPEPATARIELAPVAGLHWASSGAVVAANRFELTTPGDLVIAGVAASPVTDPGTPDFSIYSNRRESIVPMLRAAWGAHVERLGPARTARIGIVEFPAAGTKNGLAFLSSDLIVINSTLWDAIVARTPRTIGVISHEMAHRWFGGDLRPMGIATRWLAESFAEYYAWQAVRDQLGDAQAQALIDAARADAGTLPIQIGALGWDDERVYDAGALGVRALAEAVGAPRLDAAIRRIHERRLDWSVERLFAQLADDGADPEALRTFRRTWGL